MTKLKRYIANHRDSVFKSVVNLFPGSNDKHNMWRNYKVGDQIPIQFLMNADDIGITSHFIRKHIVVLSALHENNSTGLLGWIHIPENSVDKKIRICSKKILLYCNQL